ncbi:hypothetical protein RQP46_000290 [Phenoliferia psychrophenolica]
MGFLPSLLLLALSLSSLSLSSPVPDSLKPRSTKTCPTSGIISAYWPAWNGVQSPNQMPWADLSGFAMYFVAVTTATAPGFDEPDGNVAAFVSAAHAANKKAIFTIGGATGGVYFANLVRTAASRSSFANGILSFMVANSFQGVDIDWEYPGAVDASNFLAFLATLRVTVGPGYLITAAVPEFGWSFSAAPFAAYLDYISDALTHRRRYGAPWAATTGPNSPLAQCNAGSDSIQGSLALWKAAGFQACQMLLGIAGYGHQFTTYSSSLATTYFNGQSTLMFQSYNNQIPDQSPDFTALISYGWLSSDGTTGAGGFTRHWDSCNSTPFIFNPSTRVFISYDDAQSTKIKAQFAAANGLAGVNFYDSTGPTLAVLYAAKQGLTGSSAALSVSSSGLCGGSTGQTCAGNLRVLRKHLGLLCYGLPVHLRYLLILNVFFDQALEQHCDVGDKARRDVQSETHDARRFLHQNDRPCDDYDVEKDDDFPHAFRIGPQSLDERT